MTKKRDHIENLPELKGKLQEMISGSTISWDKTKEQIWPEMVKKIEGSHPENARIISLQLKRLAVAAVLIILLGVPAFMSLYTKTIENPGGQHADYIMPDNSRILINAQTTLSYKPLMWKFARKVKLDGEAFFEVQRGKKFAVISEKGNTMVLGTQFNIYSRGNDYKVTCVSGKVKVLASGRNKEVVLSQGQKALVKPDGKIEIQSGINTKQEMSWIVNRFSFTSAPLIQVFEEIGRQYGIKIIFSGRIDNIYTGTFNKGTSAEDALNFVCRPFNLSFTRKTEYEYIISKKN